MKRTLLSIVCLIVVAFPALLHAQVETPCVWEKNGRWSVKKKTTCVQMSPQTFLKYTQALRKLKYYQKDYEPAAEKIKTKYKALDSKWKSSFANWQKQAEINQKMSGEYKKIAASWKEAFWKLKDQKVPPKSWTESKVLWVGIGAAIVAGAVGLGFGLYSAVAKK